MLILVVSGCIETHPSKWMPRDKHACHLCSHPGLGNSLRHHPESGSNILQGMNLLIIFDYSISLIPVWLGDVIV